MKRLVIALFSFVVGIIFLPIIGLVAACCEMAEAFKEHLAYLRRAYEADCEACCGMTSNTKTKEAKETT